MRSQPSCKQLYTVSPGRGYFPTLSSTEMASLEAEMDRGTVGLSRQDSEMVMIYIVRTKRSDFS